MAQEKLADPAENDLSALLANDLIKNVRNILAVVQDALLTSGLEGLLSVLTAAERLQEENDSIGISGESLTAEDLRERFDAVARMPRLLFESLVLVAQGYNNKAIQKKLSMSGTTLKRRLHEIYQELNVARTSLPENSELEPRVRAVLYYQSYKLYMYAASNALLQILNISNENGSEKT